jgi:hypothetical protein
MRTLAELASKLAGERTPAGCSLWGEVEPSLEEWEEVRVAVGVGSEKAEARLYAVLKALVEKVGENVDVMIEEVVNEFMWCEMECAFALGVEVGMLGARGVSRDDVRHIVEARGIRVGKSGRQKEGAGTLEDVANELGVSVRTVRRMLR